MQVAVASAVLVGILDGQLVSHLLEALAESVRAPGGSPCSSVKRRMGQAYVDDVTGHGGQDVAQDGPIVLFRFLAVM